MKNKNRIKVPTNKNMYDLNTKTTDKKNPYIYFMMRPLSFLVAKLFIKLNISANFTTGCSLLLGIISFYFLQDGNHLSFIYASICILFSELFDFVDGNIARFKNRKTYFGKFYDGLTDDYINSLKFVFMGIGLSGLYSIAGVIISLMMFFVRYTEMRFNYVMMIKQSKSSLDKNIKSDNDRSSNRYPKQLLKTIIILPSRIISSTSTISFIILSLFHLSNIWFITFASLVSIESLFRIIMINYNAFKRFDIKYN